MGQWYIDRLEQLRSASDGRLLVAEGAKGVVGYALLDFVTADDEMDELPHSYANITDLAVIASERGKGAGTALLAACESIARGKGVDSLRLGVLAGNHRAKALYLRDGFEEILVRLEKNLR
jgi:ribosomal protein S18 acetylase RimI-like enzyme